MDTAARAQFPNEAGRPRSRPFAAATAIGGPARAAILGKSLDNAN
jgi:hypothetical protein